MNDQYSEYKMLAEKGDAEAQYNLGLCYKKGQGIPQSDEQAAYWYQKAAEQGHCRAQVNLGVCCEKGKGIPQSYEQAFYWYQKAAEQGDPLAKQHLGFSYGAIQDGSYACPVTRRIKDIKQPYGGYLPIKNSIKEKLEDEFSLNENENIVANLVGSAVDYLTRFMLGDSVDKAFHISTLGAEVINAQDKANALKQKISGLDDTSIVAACKLAGFDVCYRSHPVHYLPIEKINPDESTINNVRIMVKRSISFLEKYGPVVCSEPTFEGGYSSVVTAGDGDFITKDTLWDFKVSNLPPTSQQTLQLLMYYIMGQHSVHEHFKSIDKLGIFNPRKNTVYIYQTSSIPKETIIEVEEKVLCYGISRDDMLKMLFIEEKKRMAAQLRQLEEKIKKATANQTPRKNTAISKKQKNDDHHVADTSTHPTINAPKRQKTKIDGYSVADISNYTGVRKSIIYEDIRSGNLKAQRINNKYIVAFADYDKYLQFLRFRREQQRRQLCALLLSALIPLGLVFLFILFLSSWL